MPYVCMEMLTEFNCQSATHVKNTVVFYYIHVILHMLAMSTCSIVCLFSL